MSRIGVAVPPGALQLCGDQGFIDPLSGAGIILTTQCDCSGFANACPELSYPLPKCLYAENAGISIGENVPFIARGDRGDYAGTMIEGTLQKYILNRPGRAGESCLDTLTHRTTSVPAQGKHDLRCNSACEFITPPWQVFTRFGGGFATRCRTGFPIYWVEKQWGMVWYLDFAKEGEVRAILFGSSQNLYGVEECAVDGTNANTYWSCVSRYIIAFDGVGIIPDPWLDGNGFPLSTIVINNTLSAGDVGFERTITMPGGWEVEEVTVFGTGGSLTIGIDPPECEDYGSQRYTPATVASANSPVFDCEDPGDCFDCGEEDPCDAPDPPPGCDPPPFPPPPPPPGEGEEEEEEIPPGEELFRRRYFQLVDCCDGSNTTLWIRLAYGTPVTAGRYQGKCYALRLRPEGRLAPPRGATVIPGMDFYSTKTSACNALILSPQGCPCIYQLTPCDETETTIFTDDDLSDEVGLTILRTSDDLCYVVSSVDEDGQTLVSVGSFEVVADCEDAACLPCDSPVQCASGGPCFSTDSYCEVTWSATTSEPDSYCNAGAYLSGTGNTYNPVIAGGNVIWVRDGGSGNQSQSSPSLTTFTADGSTWDVYISGLRYNCTSEKWDDFSIVAVRQGAGSPGSITLQSALGAGQGDSCGFSGTFAASGECHDASIDTITVTVTVKGNGCCSDGVGDCVKGAGNCATGDCP